MVRGARWYDVATSALDGSLRLDGVAPDGALRFYHPAWFDGAEPFVRLDGLEPGVPVRVGFPPSATKTRTVRVRVVDAATGRPVPDVLVRAVERANGIVRFGSTERAGGPEPEGECVLRLRPGAHRLPAGSGLVRFHGEGAVDAEALVEIAAAERTARAEIEGAPEEAALAFVSATEEIDARSEEARVRDADPVYVRAHFEGTEAVAPLRPLRDGVRRARFEWRRRPRAAPPLSPAPNAISACCCRTAPTRRSTPFGRSPNGTWNATRSADGSGGPPSVPANASSPRSWGTRRSRARSRATAPTRCAAGPRGSSSTSAPRRALVSVLYLDGAIVHGAAAFDGVHRGPQLGWVAAAGHVGRALVLRDGETRRIALALPPR